MQAFHLAQPTVLLDALAIGNAADTKFIAGGTDLMQLLKDNVETPAQLVDLEGVGLSQIRVDASGLRLEAMARMSDVAAHPDVRAQWPVIAQALEASASPQVRNMGTIGGNLLQRTRCGYFRDTGFNCNKREPGSGCPAIAGENRMLAILGGSDHCIATHASDLAVALTALDAVLELRRAGDAPRQVPITEFYRLPGDNAADRDRAAAWRDDHRGHRSPQRCRAQFALSEAARPGQLRVRAGVRRGGAGRCATAPCATSASPRAASARDHGACRKWRPRCAARS